MAQPTISGLIAVAASNTDYNGIGILGTNLVSTADDAFRMLAQMLAGYSKDLAGLGTVGGTANAITLTASQPWAALANGLVLAAKNTVGPNTGATTLAVTNSAAVSLGTKAVRLQGDTALVGGEMLANGIYLFRYDTAYNSAAGAWVLLNSAGGTFSGTVTASSTASNFRAFFGTTTDPSAAGVTIDSFHNSASPAAADIIRQDYAYGKNSGSGTLPYASTRTLITDPTAGTEDGQYDIITKVAGADNTVLSLAGGVFTGGATGGDKGANTINATTYYKSGNYGVVQLGTSVASTSGATIDFTGLPVGVSRITFTFYLLSTTGTSPLLVQIGDSGGVETTGYLSGGTKVNNGSSPDSTAATTGFILEGGTVAASDTYMGTMILTKQDTAGTIWLAFGNMNRGDAGGLPTYIFSGGKTLSPGPLDRVRLTTVGGTATFDGGTINISYE